MDVSKRFGVGVEVAEKATKDAEQIIVLAYGTRAQACIVQHIEKDDGALVRGEIKRFRGCLGGGYKEEKHFNATLLVKGKGVMSAAAPKGSEKCKKHCRQRQG